MNAVPCQMCKSPTIPNTRKHEVWVDPLSVELCLECTVPVEQCHGAKGAESGGYYGPPRCAYEAAVMARRKAMARVVTLPGPDPDGVMRTWECEVG